VHGSFLRLLLDAEGTNDPWLASLNIVFRDAKAVFFVEGEDKGDKLFVADPGAELAVKQIAGGFGEGGFVYFVNRKMKRLDVEEAAFYMSGVVLETLINAAASAGRFAELAAGGDLLGLNAPDGFVDKLVVIG
jgi:hypothetical protein